MSDARSTRRAIVLGVAVVLSLTLLLGSTASANYQAGYVAECCFLTLEPGDTAGEWLDFRNTGTSTWYRDGAIPVRLGASYPRDRSSPFYNPADWLNPGRVTALDDAAVDPGAVGRFSWITRAPQQPGTYQERYTPLAELVEWMLPGDFVYLNYTVIPAQAPKLQIVSAPTRVRRGQPINVVADATDNRGVAQVTFTVGANTVTAAQPAVGSSYGASVASSGLPRGTQNIVVTAFDLGGRATSSSFAFEAYGRVSHRLDAFTPLFATQTTGGGRLGRLVGLGGVLGVPNGARLRLSCLKGCSRHVNGSRRKVKGKRLKLTLSRPLGLRRSTRIELRLSLPGHVTRFQRYRFRRKAAGTLARQTSAGCLASERPRKKTRCPR